jgi:uncharacterized membrane protein
MNDALAFWKTAHVLSAAILFGTGLGIAFFCWFGFARCVPQTSPIAPGAPPDCAGGRVVHRAGRCVSGGQRAWSHATGWSLTSPWSIAVWALFILTGACWLPVVVMQVWLSREADRVSSTKALPPRFHQWFRLWFALGVPAFTAVVLLYYLMVTKPLAVSGA